MSGTDIASLEADAFGRHVTKLREQRGMTQAQLGKAAGLSVELVKEIEAGASLDLGTICRVAGGLDMMTSDLFDGFERRDQAELRTLLEATDH